MLVTRIPFYPHDSFSDRNISQQVAGRSMDGLDFLRGNPQNSVVLSREWGNGMMANSSL